MFVASTIQLDEVNALAASMLTFASDVGREADMLELAAQQEQHSNWAGPGPTRYGSGYAAASDASS